MRVDINTGIVLDANYARVTNDNQVVFTIFDGVNEAVVFSRSVIKQNRDIELSIYEEVEKFLFRLHRDNIDTYQYTVYK